LAVPGWMDAVPIRTMPCDRRDRHDRRMPRLRKDAERSLQRGRSVHGGLHESGGATGGGPTFRRARSTTPQRLEEGEEVPVGWPQTVRHTG
jgi:hypothetical protein